MQTVIKQVDISRLHSLRNSAYQSIDIGNKSTVHNGLKENTDIAKAQGVVKTMQKLMHIKNLT